VAALTEVGALVVSAASAGEGLLVLQRVLPHVLVSDIGMPDEDGYAFLRRLRALPSERGGRTPAIALTAYTRGPDRDRALAAGFNTHMGKPVQTGALIAAIAALAAHAANNREQ
jgi:CheY-like chemotaxis protein